MRVQLLRVLWWFTPLALLCGPATGSYYAVRYLRTAPRFEVKSLAIKGIKGPLKRITEDQVVGQAELEIGTNVFQVDLQAIRERVERLQWIRYAAVQRVLPDQILVQIMEREPIGLARIGGEVYQFDIDAAIFDVDPLSGTSFPILDGLRPRSLDTNRKKVEIYLRVLDELGQTELSEVHLNDAMEVSVVSASDPMVVDLGTTDFRPRWIKYLQLRTEIRQQYPQAVKIDLRFKNQVIVRMKDDDQPDEKVVWGGTKKTL